MDSEETQTHGEPASQLPVTEVPAGYGEVEKDQFRKAVERLQSLNEDERLLLQFALEAYGIHEKTQYHICVIPDAGPIQDITCNDMASLVLKLRELYGTDVKFRAYVGTRLYTTKSPAFLVAPDGQRYPIFSSGDDNDIDESGSLSAAPALPDPTTPALPAAESDMDDDFDDEDDNPDDTDEETDDEDE